MTTHYAHSLPDVPQDLWEPLDVHLQDVATRAADFMEALTIPAWGELAGRWHDVGKYSAAFQAYLLKENGFEASLEQSKGRVNHSTAGARHAVATVRTWGRLLAYVIAGHHAGLADASGSRSSLDSRLAETIEPFDAAPVDLLAAGADLPIPPLSIDPHDEDRVAFQLSLFTRMLFSCLVDADFLATEAFLDSSRAGLRPAFNSEFLPTLRATLDVHLDELSSACEPTDVNARRAEVLAACRDAAERPTGLFSLTVPTGGGKTLASLAFALRHAERHGRRRVIYAIPFTSIIEQTADQFRCVFATLGEDVILEHHSNVDPDSRNETVKSRLAAQNWDAPLVVTTNVQLFESLFAARPSRCRKLHNLIGSVIILDEAQTLPVDLLRPCLAVVRELVADYHCTIVLCTATQPALTKRQGFPIGLEPTTVREIIPHPERLYEQMRRVQVHDLGPLSDDQLVDRLTGHESFLCIVNTRGHASTLYRRLIDQSADDTSISHLSTLMCGQHRSRVIAEIRERLKEGRPCRVISTQLIEAGVDVDFPVVYRALSGLDSIAQASGRCNREGNLDRGNVYVFEPTDVRLRGYLAQVTSTAAEVMPGYDDLLDPVAIRRYFELHYWQQGAATNQWDKPNVMGCFPTPPDRFAFNFRTAAERFRMIEDATQSIFVPYEKSGARLVDRLYETGPDRRLLRRLQRYTVNVFEYIYNEMIQTGDIDVLEDGGYAVLTNPDAYDNRLGLRIDRPGYMEAETLIG